MVQFYDTLGQCQADAGTSLVVKGTVYWFYLIEAVEDFVYLLGINSGTRIAYIDNGLMPRR